MIIFTLAACLPTTTATPQITSALLIEKDGLLYLDLAKVQVVVNEDGTPVSTRITQDESLGTVHTFDLLPVIILAPTRSPQDGLWRLQVWVAAEGSIEQNGYLVTLALGFDDTLIEYDLLPGYIFEWKSGNTETIAAIVPDLRVGDQIFVHVIGEHSFADEDMAAIAKLGFGYPQLVEGHEEENMLILNALATGKEPPAGEIRGVGLIYRGTE